ncbi:MAG: [ribosomal protein S5]-alanine N-acetyltransferase [Rhodospirillaceae bacterium]|jgi:ribosomal-protein-alanine N-acetyltransferase|nr:[ribosomal protein S5]-alanine N-acetyltransferase [Rhodospirillaceae bacterium]
MLSFGLSRGPRLETATLFLRRPRLTDWRAWSGLRGASRDFLVPWEPSWPDDALTMAAYRRRLRQMAMEWRGDQGYGFSIFLIQGGVLVGGANLSHVRRGVAQAASLGYWMGAAYAHQGLMGEALTALLPYAFDRLGLHRIEAACLPHNKPSRALLAKLGFRDEGYAAKYLKINGQWQDHVLHALLAEEYRRRG